MIIGSHNTMSYMKPKKWWMRLFRFMAKCQDKTIQEQYEFGARLFDIRLVFDKDGNVGFAHGLIDFEGDLDNILSYLDSCRDKIYVRILNERNKNFDLFKKKCMQIQLKYRHIIFYGGQNKKDWKQLFCFDNTCGTCIDKYSSMNNDTNIGTGWHLDDLWPRIYAICFNKYWRKKYQNKNIYLMQDFVGVY